MKWLGIVFIFIVFTVPAMADVYTDIETGSGGLSVTKLESGVRLMIFAAMLLFVAWVLKSILGELINSEVEDWNRVFAVGFKSALLCLLIIVILQ